MIKAIQIHEGPTNATGVELYTPPEGVQASYVGVVLTFSASAQVYIKESGGTPTLYLYAFPSAGETIELALPEGMPVREGRHIRGVWMGEGVQVEGTLYVDEGSGLPGAS